MIIMNKRTRDYGGRCEWEGGGTGIRPVVQSKTRNYMRQKKRRSEEGKMRVTMMTMPNERASESEIAREERDMSG